MQASSLPCSPAPHFKGCPVRLFRPFTAQQHLAEAASGGWNLPGLSKGIHNSCQNPYNHMAALPSPLPKGTTTVLNFLFILPETVYVM